MCDEENKRSGNNWVRRNGSGVRLADSECNKDVVLYGIVKDSRRYREKPVLVNGRKLSLQYCSFEEQMNHQWI